MKIVYEALCFCVSGVIGFMVDTAVLYVLRPYLGLFVGRLLSFIAAVLATWLFNRNITFSQRHSGLKKKNEFMTYLLLMLAGGGVNYAVYSWMVLAYEYVSDNPVIGIAAGSLAGMFINLSSSRWLLFRHTH